MVFEPRLKCMMRGLDVDAAEADRPFIVRGIVSIQAAKANVAA